MKKTIYELENGVLVEQRVNRFVRLMQFVSKTIVVLIAAYFLWQVFFFAFDKSTEIYFKNYHDYKPVSRWK